MLTLGRHPTLQEVCDYYSRDDILTFLQRTCAVRKVALVIPSKNHWEPDWEGGRVPETGLADLREFVLGRIRRQLAGVAADERPPYYPSFHQSVDHWPEGQVGRAKAVGCDGVCEADLPTWRLAFQDVFTLLSVLREEGVPHRCKFSGHRSLHLVIPFADGKVRAAGFGGSRTRERPELGSPFAGAARDRAEGPRALADRQH